MSMLCHNLQKDVSGSFLQKGPKNTPHRSSGSEIDAQRARKMVCPLVSADQSNLRSKGL